MAIVVIITLHISIFTIWWTTWVWQKLGRTDNIWGLSVLWSDRHLSIFGNSGNINLYVNMGLIKFIFMLFSSRYIVSYLNDKMKYFLSLIIHYLMIFMLKNVSLAIFGKSSLRPCAMRHRTHKRTGTLGLVSLQKVKLSHMWLTLKNHT